MKCSFCLYEHKPDNFITLKAHAEEHITNDETRGGIPVVVWRDREFILIEKAEKEEKIYDIFITDPKGLVQEDLGFKPLPDEDETLKPL